MTTRTATSRKVLTTSSIGTRPSSFPLGTATAGGAGIGCRCGAGIAGGWIAAYGCCDAEPSPAQAVWQVQAGWQDLGRRRYGTDKCRSWQRWHRCGRRRRCGRSGRARFNVAGRVGDEIIRVYSPGPEPCFLNAAELPVSSTGGCWQQRSLRAFGE